MSEVVGVGGERPLAGERILVDADAGGAGERGAEGERAVGVADHANGARFGILALRRGAIEDEPVGGVDRDQPRGLEVRAPPQAIELGVHAPTLDRAASPPA